MNFRRRGLLPQFNTGSRQASGESVERARAWLGDVVGGAKPSVPVPDDPHEGPVKAVTTATFPSEVLQSDVPVIVDFWAPWCGPCRQVGPIVEQIALMRPGAYKVVKVNIYEEPALAQQYGGMPAAASALGYASVGALQGAIGSYCGN